MGTNFYLLTEALADKMPELSVLADKIEFLHGSDLANEIRAVGQKRLHIGKSSHGWVFSLHVFTDNERQEDPSLPTNLKDWVEGWFSNSSNRIVNEYGDVLTVEEMLEIITERGSETPRDYSPHTVPRGYLSWNDFFSKNHALPGPRGLLRHRIQPGWCVAHGEGTWDLIPGEFS